MTLSLPHIHPVSTCQNPDSIISSNSSNDTSNNRDSNQVATESSKKRPAKPHVKTACVNCKKAHLACDLARPCKRCVSSDKADTCYDIQHKKRGRPKLRGMKPMHCHLPSTFTMIQSSPSKSNCGNTLNYQKPTMTIFLSMELCCARVSDESFDFLGLYPQEFLHRSLYGFITPQNSATVSRIHRSLLDNAVTFSSTHDKTDNNDHHYSQQKRARLLPPTQRTTADMFIALPPYQLATIANGSLTLKDTITFMTSDKSQHQTLDARFYLGGGNGADLMQPDSLQHLYIVCILTPTDPSLSSSLAPTCSKQHPVLPNNLPLVEKNSSSDKPIYTTNGSMTLETTPSYSELQSIDFGQDQLRSSSLESEAPTILDFEQDDDQQQLSLKRSANGTDHIGFTDPTASSWHKPCTTTTPSPPLSPTSSFTLALQLSSPSSYRRDSSYNLKISSDMDIQQTENAASSSVSAAPTRQPGNGSSPLPVPSTSSFKSSLSSKHLLPYSAQPYRHRQICHQQPHQLYYQTMLSSRLSVEAQALARSTRMLTSPAMSAPTTYNIAKMRHPRLPYLIPNTVIPLSSSSFSTSSSSSSSSSSSASSSPSSGTSICQPSTTIPAPTATSSTNPTPIYILPSATITIPNTKLSIYYD